MNRRAFLFAGLAVSSSAFSTVRAEPAIQVIYVGGRDCPYCTMWKNEYKAAWMASPEFKQIAWIEVDSPKLREAYQERFWPGRLRDILEQIPHKNGTPRFLIVKDGRIVSNELGVNHWEGTLVRLKKLLG